MTPLVDVWHAAADIVDPPPWEPKDRPPLEPYQQPPGGSWDLWILEGGRGSGKTEACSRYFAKYMHENPGHRGRIIAPTQGDAIEACILGPSGLNSIDPEAQWRPSAPGGAKVTWPNGSEALVMGTHSPTDVDRLRAAGNRHIDWWEEMAANTQLGSKAGSDNGAWDQAAFGLRLGEHPHAIASTTPRNSTAYRAVRDQDGVAFTHASIFDNPHLPQVILDRLRKKYEGTRLGRQELMGELLEDVEGALWTRKLLDACRVDKAPELASAATAVDPAATSGPNSADTGIIAVGLGIDNHGYILLDRTCHLPPEGWGQRVVRTHAKIKGDYVVGEANNGGEMVEHVVATADANVPYEAVYASRGKQTRAQPVAALFGAPPKRKARVHLVGQFPELEDQLMTWVPDSGDPSPDRLDAMVWGITKLMLAEEEETRIVEDYQPVRIGAQL